MIETIVLNHLIDELESDNVYMETPEHPPDSYVVIEKTGSGRANHISSATFAIQSYSPTLAEAAQLNEEVKTAMDALSSNDSIGRCELDTDYNFTNTATRQYRYQAVFNITHY